MATTINLGKLKKEMEGWPKSWAGFNSDIPIGQRIVQTMYPFLLAMVAEGYSKTTINRHASNLWLLGGEIIHYIHTDLEMEEFTGEELILRFVDEECGPYSRHLATEQEQKRSDATGKKLYRFLSQKPPRA